MITGHINFSLHYDSFSNIRLKKVENDRLLVKFPKDYEVVGISWLFLLCLC